MLLTTSITQGAVFSNVPCEVKFLLDNESGGTDDKKKSARKKIRADCAVIADFCKTRIFSEAAPP